MTVDKAGMIHVDETSLTFSSFVRRSGRSRRREGKDGIYLRADQGVPYGTVAKVLAVMRTTGIADVGLVLEPEQEP